MKLETLIAAAALAALSVPAAAAPVVWIDWTSGTPGANGSASGVVDLGAPGPDASDISVEYAGEIAFIQTSGGTNYWTGNPSPYVSPEVDNAPGTPDIIALSSATSKTLTFSAPVDNLFFAVVSLNGNGYAFNEDFDILSYGCGYWGCGTLTKEIVGSEYRLIGSGEPHGVIRFNRAVTSITWTSLTNEYWNGFTVGTYGAAPPIPEPSTLALASLGLLGIIAAARRRRDA
ncbi:MAG: PEP-CTERM sorting domain-containing protein [Burkholderiaceae bacterium]|nr:PEP-CTERM sorting domain-containing protein [Burkholderiaceae bacterium]